MKPTLICWYVISRFHGDRNDSTDCFLVGIVASEATMMAAGQWGGQQCKNRQDSLLEPSWLTSFVTSRDPVGAFMVDPPYALVGLGC